MPRYSRRQIVGGGTALLIGAGLKGEASGAALRGRLNADVCVVGAGYAGLSAAYRLKQAGAKVIVLEARKESADARLRPVWKAAAGLISAANGLDPRKIASMH